MKLGSAISLVAVFLPFATSRNTGNWVKTSQVNGPNSSYFGSACSMNANLIAVGAPYDTPVNTQKDAGMVHLVNRNEGSLKSIKDFTGTKFDQLGQSVALSKGIKTGNNVDDTIDVIAIGAPRHSINDDQINVGMVKVFYYSNLKEEWLQLGQDLTGKRNDDFFGESVAISDDGMVIAVGIPIGDHLHRGRVEMYKYNEITDKWDKMGSILEGHMKGAKFGSSVSIAQKQNNDANPENYFVAAGAPEYGKGQGIVQVYSWDNDLGDWDQLGSTMSGDQVQDQMGYSISMSMIDSHLYLAIGIPSAKYYGSSGAGAQTDDDYGYGQSSDGRVQVYKYNTDLKDDTEWLFFGDEIEQLDDGDGTGETVVLSQDAMFLAIGSPDYGNGAGMVRVYRYDSGYGDYLRIGDTLYGLTSEAFGTCISFHGNYLVVGAPYGDNVQIYSYDSSLISGSNSSSASTGTFKSVITSILVIVIIAFLAFFAVKKLKRKGFRWSSFAAALPGAAAIRRRGRQAVSTEDQRDEWPFPFFSPSDRARIEEVRRAEEGRSHEDVDGVVLHGMPKSSGSQDASSSSGSDEDDDGVSYSSKDDSVKKMRQIT